jgi:hemoglobin
MGIPAPVGERTELANEADVERLVRRFYQAVIPDPQLGPIFHDFGVDWSVHIPKLVDFWAFRLLDRPGYRGNAVGAHQAVLDRCPFGDAELERWLELWEETVDELFVGETASRAKERAHLAGDAIASLMRRHARGQRSIHVSG